MACMRLEFSGITKPDAALAQGTSQPKRLRSYRRKIPFRARAVKGRFTDGLFPLAVLERTYNN